MGSLYIYNLCVLNKKFDALRVKKNWVKSMRVALPANGAHASADRSRGALGGASGGALLRPDANAM